MQTLLFTEKTDVWSFGVFCYEVFTDGQTPYAGIRNADLMDQLKWGYRLPPVPSVPRRIYGLCRSCWEKKATERWSFQKMEKGLKDILKDIEYTQISSAPLTLQEGKKAKTAGIYKKSRLYTPR